MAASNYFGFTHATGPQYSTQPPPAYSHSSTVTYNVQQAPAVPHAVTASYSPGTVQAAQPVVSAPYAGYQSHQPPPDYTYRPPDPPALPQPTTTPQTYQVYSDTQGNYSYDNKQYYQTSIAPAQMSTTDNYYQTVSMKSAYTPAPTTLYSHPPPIQRQVTTLTPSSSVSTNYIYPVSSSAQQPQTSISSYNLRSTFSSTPSAATFSGHNYSNYDSTGYTCTSAPSYYQSAPQTLSQPQKQQPPSHQPQQPLASKQLTSASWSNPGSNMVTSSVGSTYKKPAFHQNKLQKPKGPAKQPQLHYCDICRISCAGPQTYWEHLQGQKHKKKEAALKTGGQTGTCNGPRGVQTQLRCELCDVSCTGVDAYAAHIRGSKHQKVVKLHTKLGKPIPSIEPVLVNSAPVVKTSTTAKQQASTTDVASVGTTSTSTAAPKPAVNSAAKTLTTIKKLVPSKITSNKPAAPPGAEATKVETTVPQAPQEECDKFESPGDIKPVGHDYVEEVCNGDGKVIRFHCKLCECSFNDPNAKDMHLKGRRHRLQYKRKVNPELSVEIKPSNRARKLQESKLKKQKAVLKRQQDDEQHWHMEMRRYEDNMYWRRMAEEQMYCGEQRHRMAPPPLMSRPGRPVPPLLSCVRPLDSPDDRVVMAKHTTIYPGELELQAVQRIVSHSEQALKMVSDNLFEKNITTAATESGDLNSTESSARLLKGVMRVGILAKGLLLRGDTNVHLILLTAKKPTVSLLKSIAKQLPKELATFSEDQYEVQAHPEEANVIILSSKEPIMQVTVSLTSPLMRDDTAAEKDKQAGGKAAEKDVAENDPPDLLNKKKCLEHLAALRHAKWFQARANGLQSCVIIIRVLRDLCQRVPIWGKMPSWAMELLVEKVISSVIGPLSPGEALRRVLECMATGILLSDGSGLSDPCERQPTDALESMKVQDREDVTSSAQHALRLLAFHQIHEVLGMNSMTKGSARNRKRQLDVSDTSEGEGQGKKDKKEEVVNA
ncbi:zinc finger RNA-binding protein isoform X1 [Phycodurus eques]|uniref:zinc finger RNA-binding protein isoform X1 n=1 Tax=Phycodurus eques TaxID=693459 RepID=UPI002ACD2562|nr:zinc finger RNA-binding protein isoform X1 [Phycodurus eques]